MSAALSIPRRSSRACAHQLETREARCASLSAVGATRKEQVQLQLHFADDHSAGIPVPVPCAPAHSSPRFAALPHAFFLLEGRHPIGMGAVYLHTRKDSHQSYGDSAVSYKHLSPREISLHLRAIICCMQAVQISLWDRSVAMTA